MPYHSSLLTIYRSCLFLAFSWSPSTWHFVNDFRSFTVVLLRASPCIYNFNSLACTWSLSTCQPVNDFRSFTVVILHASPCLHTIPPCKPLITFMHTAHLTAEDTYRTWLPLIHHYAPHAFIPSLLHLIISTWHPVNESCSFTVVIRHASLYLSNIPNYHTPITFMSTANLFADDTYRRWLPLIHHYAIHAFITLCPITMTAFLMIHSLLSARLTPPDTLESLPLTHITHTAWHNTTCSLYTKPTCYIATDSRSVATVFHQPLTLTPVLTHHTSLFR